MVHTVVSTSSSYSRGTGTNCLCLRELWEEIRKGMYKYIYKRMASSKCQSPKIMVLVTVMVDRLMVKGIKD